MSANGAKRTLAERGLPDLGMSNLSLYVTLDLMHQRRCARLRNLDGAARVEIDQDQILDGPRAKGFRAWYRLSAPFGSLPASNFTAARFLSDSGDWSWPRKSVASKTMPGACSAGRPIRASLCYSESFNLRACTASNLNDVPRLFRLTIASPCFHQLAALLQRIAAAVCLLGLVSNNVRQRRLRNFTGKLETLPAQPKIVLSHNHNDS